MPDTRYPFQMAGGVPVVTAPAEIDLTNAGRLQAILAEWHARGHATVAVDLTGTRFCDSAGLRVLVRAHQRAVGDGGGLRLVIPADGPVAQIFTVTGLAGVIPRFASLDQALAQVPATATRPRRQGGPREPPAAPACLPAQDREPGLAGESRSCAQCGAVFVPQREHARFCTAGCRAAWNREHLGDPAVEASALTWSVTAMSEATGRLPMVKAWDQERAFAAIGEAVWWITMVDATLVRHHAASYDIAMAAHDPAEQRLIHETLTGLRFVRNWIGRGAEFGELIQARTITADSRRITGCTWKPVPEPPLASLPGRARAWEISRYRAYQAHLAGHTIGETFGPAVTFLAVTGTSAVTTIDAS